MVGGAPVSPIRPAGKNAASHGRGRDESRRDHSGVASSPRSSLEGCLWRGSRSDVRCPAEDRAAGQSLAGSSGRGGGAAAVTVDHPFLVRHADIVFALKTFAAAMLALVIALWLDLPRPYWAMATGYITSQPPAGATSSKAFYRVLGTVLGASVTVAMVPNLVNAPELLCLPIGALSSSRPK